MNHLNGLALPAGTRWTNQLNWQPVQQTQARTTGGGLVITSQGLRKGRPINLELKEQYAWFNYSEIQLIILWASSPNDTFPFQWNDTNYLVMFDNSQAPHEFYQVADYNEIDQDYFHGKINLITI